MLLSLQARGSAARHVSKSSESHLTHPADKASGGGNDPSLIFRYTVDLPNDVAAMTSRSLSNCIKNPLTLILRPVRLEMPS